MNARVYVNSERELNGERLTERRNAARTFTLLGSRSTTLYLVFPARCEVITYKRCHFAAEIQTLDVLDGIDPSVIFETVNADQISWLWKRA